MSIFVMGSGCDLQWLNTNIPHVDIPINTWIQLIQNNFKGVKEGDENYFRQKYKVQYDSNLPKVVNYFKTICSSSSYPTLFIFYHDNITRALWENVVNLLTKMNKNSVVIGLTRCSGKFKHDNILMFEDEYDKDKICRHLNKFLLKNTM